MQWKYIIVVLLLAAGTYTITKDYYSGEIKTSPKTWLMRLDIPEVCAGDELVQAMYGKVLFINMRSHQTYLYFDNIETELEAYKLSYDVLNCVRSLPGCAGTEIQR